MGQLEIQLTQYGTWEVITSTGAQFRLNERGGRLEVRTQEGLLVVHPRSSNSVEVAAADWDGQEVGNGKG